MPANRSLSRPARRSTRASTTPVLDVRRGASIEPVPLGAGDKLFTGIATPEEFFRRPQHLHALCDTLAQRFRARAPWVVYEDAYQEAALEVVNCRRKFKPEKGYPFGGYAWSSAIFKLTEMMQRGSVPVSFDRSHGTPGESGANIVDRVLRGISTVRLDAPASGSDDTASTVGEVLSIDDTELAPADAATRDRRSTILAAFDAAAEGLPSTVVDLMLAYLDGQTLGAEDYPRGWNLDRLARTAERFSAVLRRIMGEADARLRAGDDVTPAELHRAAAYVPPTAPVTAASPLAEIAALGSAITDPVQFDAWGGAFLSIELPLGMRDGTRKGRPGRAA